jgi:hypothetical protein
MDKTKPNTREHRLDLERNFTPKLEPGSQNFKAGRVDTLSHDANVTATKFLVTITVVKDGKMGEYLTELRRMTVLFDKFNGPWSYFNLIKYQAGSNPTIITIRLLKNGYKELEAGYFSYPPDTFRDTYVNEYGQQAWDKRVKLMVDDVISQEEHFEEWRKDLSSKQ